MVDKSKSDGGPAGRGVYGLATVVILALVALAAIYGVTRNQTGGEIELTPGGVKVRLERGDSLGDLIKRVMADDAQRAELAALLAPYDFYDIQDVRWTNRLREVDVKPEVRDGARQLLYDLAGPFRLPDTFTKADQGLYAAVAALDEKLQLFRPDDPEAQANPFFAMMWLDQINQDGVFGPRLFNAAVTDLPGPHEILNGRHVVYVCARSSLRDRLFNVVLDVADRPHNLIKAVGKVDLVRFDCNDPAQTLPRYLAQQRARLGIAGEGFQALYGPVEAGSTTPPRVFAKFLVAPENYAPVEPPKPRIADGG